MIEMGRESRNTRQKRLLQDSAERIGAFFSAEELHERVLKKDPSIGIATVYRFLKSSDDLFSYRCGTRKVFSKGKKSHCHFVCEKTGKVIHFDLDNIDFLKDKIPGSITSFQLEVRGVCKDCK